MSRRCAVCDHKHVKQINRLLIAGVSYRNITQLVSKPVLSKYSLSRHKKEHIPDLVAKAARDREGRDIDEAKDLVQQCNEYLHKANELLDACEEWLRDPITGKLELDPRASEITVYYSDGSFGREIRRRAPLSELLSAAEKKLETIVVTGWRYKHADPRELFLKSIDRGAKVVELLGKLSGELSVLSDLDVIIELVVQALQPYPESLRQVMEGLRAENMPLPSRN